MGCLAANASTLYNNGAPDQLDGREMSSFIAADDFKLSTAVSLTGAAFWSSSNIDPFASQFSGVVGWAIFSDNAGAPGALLASGADAAPALTDTGLQILGTEEFRIDITLPPTLLTAGTYWLGLHENSLGTPTDGTSIYWDTTSSQTGSSAMVTNDLTGSGGWYQASPGIGPDLAFILSGTAVNSNPVVNAAPEPGFLVPSCLLLAAALFRVGTRHSRATPTQEYPTPPVQSCRVAASLYTSRKRSFISLSL